MTGRIPPIKHLRKIEARLGRLEEMGLHEHIRPGGVLRHLPDKRTRREYMDVHDKLLGEDLPNLLDALMGREGEDE